MAGAGHAALLLLGDGRLPTGGYAHSGGLEAAIARGWVRSPRDLADFLRGRAHTVGFVAACCAAAALPIAGDAAALRRLDAELVARTPSPALREVGATLGRMLVRAMCAVHPHELLASAPRGLQQPVAYGVVGAALGLDARQVAGLVLHENVTGPATAAVKLMSLDPFTAHAAVAELTGELDELATQAAEVATGPIEDLPATTGPLSDLAGELHARADMRLFAS